MSDNTFAQVHITTGEVRAVSQLFDPEQAVDGYIDEANQLVTRDLPEGVDEMEVLREWYWDNGWQHAGAAPSIHHQLDPTSHGWVVDLEGVRRQYLIDIDVSAGQARGRYITTSPGQAETYLAKYEDALAYQFDPTASHPWVTADAEARGMTEAEAAASIIALRDAWVQKGVEIERARMAGKTSVGTATTVRDCITFAEETEKVLDAL